MPTAAAALGSTVIFGTTVKTILANIAVAYLAGKVLAPSKPTSQGKGALKETIRSGIEPRKICYGEGYTSGPLTYAGLTSDGGKINKYLHLIITLTTHPVEDISSIYMDELELSLTTGGKYSPKLNLADTQERLNSYIIKNLNSQDEEAKYQGLIRVIPVTGKWMYYTSGETNPDIVDDYTRWLDVKNSIGSAWGMDHRLDRCSFLYVRLEHDSDVWSSIPNFYVKMRGANLYNPLQDRDFYTAPYLGTIFEDRGNFAGSTTYKIGDLVDGQSYVCIRGNVSQSVGNSFYWKPTYANLRNNPQLWEYETNWALCVLDYLLNDKYGLKLRTSGILNELDWYTMMDTIKDAYDGGYLDVSRSTVPASRLTNLSNYPRIAVNGIVETSSTPIDNLETLFTAANGEMAYCQGKHFLRAGIYAEPYYNPTSFPATIVDESYLADSPISLNTATPNSSIFNSVTGVYISNDNESRGEPVEMEPIYVESYILDDGEEYIEDRDYPVTLSEDAARNLAKQSLEETRQAETLNLNCNIKILKFKVGEVICFKNDVLGYSSQEYTSMIHSPSLIPKIFKIISMTIKEGLNVEVGLQEINYSTYDPSVGLSASTTGTSPLLTTSDTIVGAPILTVDNISEFYARYDNAIAANTHYVDISWTAPTGIDGLQFGGSQIDWYEVKWAKVDDHVTNPSGVLQNANVTVNISGNTITSATVVSGGYGYWIDGYIEVSTNITGDDRALLSYTSDGSGAIESVQIINGGSGYTNGTGVSILSDLPNTVIADPDENNDDVHEWKRIVVYADVRRDNQKTYALRLDEVLGDYIFAVRSIMGNLKSDWVVATKTKSGDEVVYGIPTPITQAYSYGDDTHVYAQFDLTDSAYAGDDNLSYIEWFIGDTYRNPTNYTQSVFDPVTATKSAVFKSYLNIPANWAQFEVDGRILTPIVSLSLAAYQDATAVAWRPYWLWARIVNTGGVASPWYPSLDLSKRGIPTGLGRGDAQNLLPLPSEYDTDESVAGGDETPVVSAGSGGGPFPADSGTTPTAPVEDGGGDPDSDTGVYNYRDVRFTLDETEAN